MVLSSAPYVIRNLYLIGCVGCNNKVTFFLIFCSWSCITTFLIIKCSCKRNAAAYFPDNTCFNCLVSKILHLVIKTKQKKSCDCNVTSNCKKVYHFMGIFWHHLADILQLSENPICKGSSLQVAIQ